MIAKTTSAAIWDHMLEDWPIEACGLVWDDGSITRLRNQAASPSRFTVGRTQLAEALAAVSPDEKLLAGVYHSHPNASGNLSDEDRESMKLMWLRIEVPWIIATRQINDAVAFDKLTVWVIDEDGWFHCEGAVHRSLELTHAV